VLGDAWVQVGAVYRAPGRLTALIVPWRRPSAARLQEAGHVREAVIVEAVRTPVGKGKPGGALSGWHPVDLLAETLQALVGRAGIDPGLIDDVIGGCVDQVGEQSVNV